MLDLSHVEIRPEQPRDFREIETLVQKAFESVVEPELVRLIRGSSNYVPELSLVAVKDRRVLGHIMLSYIHLHDGGGRHRVLTLSPLAVAPESQGQGVGSTLVRRAVQLADQHGEPLVCLEGSPTYYARFGFTDSRDSGIYFDLPEGAPDNAGQILKLRNYDPSVAGQVIYPSAFVAATGPRQA